MNNTINDSLPRLIVNPEKSFKENTITGEELLKNNKTIFISSRGRTNSLCLDIAIALMRKHDSTFFDGKPVPVNCFTDTEPNTKKKVTRIELLISNNKKNE